MILRRQEHLLLFLGAIVLLEGCCSPSSHSLTSFYTSMSDPRQGLYYFISTVYVDDQLFVLYDSRTRRVQFSHSWMESLRKEEIPHLLERETYRVRVSEEWMVANMEILTNGNNQSKGLHTLQQMIGCELRGDGSRRAFLHFGYDGQNMNTFDKKTLTWMADEPKAQITKKKLDAETHRNKRCKSFLEEECFGRMQSYLSYQTKNLKTVSPVVTMRSKTEGDGMETHVCRMDGFYPKEIDASWRRDGEVWLQDTFCGLVSPNPDGTYHFWISIKVDPQERGRYQCHVEHDGLQVPLGTALNVAESNLGLILGCVLAPLVLVIAIAGIWVCLRRRRVAYRAAPGNFANQ